MQKHIVRQSDFYGIVGVDFRVEDVFWVTQAFLIWLQPKITLQRVVVGMDGRLTSAAMYQQVTQAITAAGYQVSFVGVCPIAVLTSSLYHVSAQVGIMITGSASSSEYNGLKLYFNSQLVEGFCLQEIYDLAVTHRSMVVPVAGKVMPCPIVDQYLDSLWQEFAHLSEYQFSMVLDAGNGTMGPVLRKLIYKMGWKHVSVIHEEVNGFFPHHLPEPCNDKNLELLKVNLKMMHSAFGVAFDGDGDRFVVIDEKGIIISPERMIAIFAQRILARHGQRTIVHDIGESSWLDYVLYQAHGKVVAIKDPLLLLTDVITTQKPIFVGLKTGQYLFFDRHAGYPDALYVLLRLLDILAQQRCMMHDLIVQLPRQIIKYPQHSSSIEQSY